MITVSRLEAFDKAPWQQASGALRRGSEALTRESAELRSRIPALEKGWTDPAARIVIARIGALATLLDGLADQQICGAKIIEQATGMLGFRKADLSTSKATILSRPATLADDGTVTLTGDIPHESAPEALAYLALWFWARSMTYTVRQLLLRAEAELSAYDAALLALHAEAVPTDRSGPIDLDDESIRLTIDINQQDRYGDCVTLAMLSGKGRADPDWVREHLKWDPVTKTYVVTVHDPRSGKAAEVRVDPSTLPASGAQAYGSGQPTWLSVMEEAYRQKYPGVIDGGGASHEDVAKMVTGQTVSRTVASFHDIRATLDGPPPGNVVVGTSGAVEKQPDAVDPSKRTVVLPTGNRDATHAYSVRGFDGQGRIVLQNPWGPQGGFIGDKFYPGELHLTEDEFGKWFHTATQVPGQ